MNPALEQTIIAALVMGAFGYLVARIIRKRRAGKACANDCGCSVAGKSLPTRSK